MKPKLKRPPTPAQIDRVFGILQDLYPAAETELTYEGPFQLLIAVILSAQCTDARVNMTTPALFARYPDAESLSKAKQLAVEKLVHSCGFYRAKAKAIRSTAKDLHEKFGGEVPKTLEELTSLAGVGRKTASVVLSHAFGIPAIAVDTHVLRLSNRLGWVQEKNPVKIERQLRELLPKKYWSLVNTMLILHGRRVCKARKPQCEICELSRHCASFGKFS